MALSEIEERCVLPFYLEMMGLNAIGSPVLYSAVRSIGAQLCDDEVAGLLRGLWRPRVMGAWFAAGRQERLADDLLESLETSQGTLTAPPLAVVAMNGIGTLAVPSLETYLDVSLVKGFGDSSFIAAALERLGTPADGVTVTDGDRRHLRVMTAVAAELAGA